MTDKPDPFDYVPDPFDYVPELADLLKLPRSLVRKQIVCDEIPRNVVYHDDGTVSWIELDHEIVLRLEPHIARLVREQLDRDVNGELDCSYGRDPIRGFPPGEPSAPDGRLQYWAYNEATDEARKAVVAEIQRQLVELGEAD